MSGGPRSATAVILFVLAAACTRTPSQAPSRVDDPGGGLTLHPGASLSAIDGASATDIWAVGERHAASARQHSLAAHWDGSFWRLVSVPDVGPLQGLDVTGPEDAWAVGGHSLLHWNGAAWSATPLPRGDYGAVSATGPSDVWVAGVQPGPMIGKNSVVGRRLSRTMTVPAGA